MPPEWVTRIDVSLDVSRDCEEFAGEFELRFYNAEADPLDPAAVMPAGSDSVTGRRIAVP